MISDAVRCHFLLESKVRERKLHSSCSLRLGPPCYHNQECLRCNGILIISKALSIVYSSPLLALWLQHMGKHFPLSLLTPYLLSSQWQTSHQCGVHIGLYTLSSRRVLCIGYRIMKGISERCIARLLLTL